MHFNFWKWWLFYSSLLFALFGLVFAMYGNNPLFQPYNSALAQIFFDGTDFPSGADKFRAFIYGPLGGTIACAYILTAFIAYYPFANKEKWSFIAITVAFGLWAVVDSAIAIYYQVTFQVYLINAFSVMVKALPLVFTWKHFFKKGKADTK